MNQRVAMLFDAINQSVIKGIESDLRALCGVRDQTRLTA